MVQSIFRAGPFAAAVLGCLGVSASAAIAQNYPTPPIKIIVANPPGGIADLVGRTFAQKLSERGMTAVVENRTGAGGAIAAEAVAKALPDGHTLLVSMHQTNAILQHLTNKLTYAPLRDFAPILHTTATFNNLVVDSSVPVKTMEEFVTCAKANPGTVTYASQGNGVLAMSSVNIQAAGWHRHRPRALSRRGSGQSGP